MAFTTQALASVAYQVGNLAGHTLRMLDLQAASLRQVEARVNTLGQVRGVWEGLLHRPPILQRPLLGHFLRRMLFLAFLQVPSSTTEAWRFPSVLSLLLSGYVSVLGLAALPD